MQIKFELEKKDILAFHIYTIFHNKSLRLLYLILLCVPVYMVLSPIIQWMLSGVSLLDLPGDVLWATAIYVFWNLLYAISMQIGFFVFFNAIWLFLLMMKYKKNDGTLGEHLIELRDDGLFEATAVNESVNGWKGVQRIVELKNYLLIYISATNAHIIPKRFFHSAEEKELFTAETVRLMESAKTNYSPSYLTANS